ncbi:hypothetical protein BH23ACT2_BH23ACT2_08430 [soil metagenome]
MASNTATAVALRQIGAGLDALRVAGVDPVDAADARDLIGEVEHVGRRVRAVQVELVDQIDRQGLHRGDGHASAKVLVRHVAGLSDAEAARRASAARALRSLPAVREAFAVGDVGVCHIDRIARAHANVRVRERLCGHDQALATQAAAVGYRHFDGLVTDWVRRADEDGTRDASQRTHDNRDAKMVQDFDGSWKLTAGCGSLQGAELYEILRRFTEAEFATDWARARERHGDAATTEHLGRTDGQRRCDALHSIFQRAAAARVGANGGSQIVTNIVIDHTTFERELRRLFGTDPGPADTGFGTGTAGTAPGSADTGFGAAGAALTPDGVGTAEGDGSTPGDNRAPDRHDSLDGHFGGDDAPDDEGASDGDETDDASAGAGFRCSTLDGHPVDVTEAVAAALVGRVRRVVIGADSVVIDLGRRRRLFTGPAQLAARLGATHCYWPGCHVPVTDCQTDHLRPWGDGGGGCTDPGNGGAACGKHNRHRQAGFTVTRDPAGQWHTYRPDGTEIE